MSWRKITHVRKPKRVLWVDILRLHRTTYFPFIPPPTKKGCSCPQCIWNQIFRVVGEANLWRIGADELSTSGWILFHRTRWINNWAIISSSISTSVPSIVLLYQFTCIELDTPATIPYTLLFCITLSTSEALLTCSSLVYTFSCTGLIIGLSVAVRAVLIWTWGAGCISVGTLNNTSRIVS